MKDKERKKQKNKEKKPKKKMKLWKKILILILLVLIAAGGWFIYKSQKNGGGLTGMLATVVGHDEFTKKNLPEMRVLVLGVSNGIDAKLTDTIMVASYNPNTQKGTLLSIPRDTYIGANTRTATAGNKINAIYGISQDPQKVLDKVNEITNLDIKYYVVIETNALRELVDSIGGVTFDVPINMDYDDEGQKLAIHIKKGEQLLNGEQAEGVVRFRHNNNGTSYPVEYGDNDLGRMKTQREFIKAVAKQTIKLENVLKIGKWVDIFEKNVKSNIDFDVVKDYIPYGVEFNVEDLLTATLPGTTPNMSTTNNVSIFVVNKAETQKMIKELFVDRDIVEDEEDDDATTESNNISVELLNGSGDTKTLENVAGILKKAGYSVKKKEQTNITSKTSIINKKDIEQEQLEKLKEELGVGTIQNSKSSSSKVDITIIIGQDYK